MRSEAWRLLAAAAVALLSWPVTAVDTGSRPLPTFVSLRHPQSFAGTLPASADPQKPNGTAKVSLHLYSVVPDAADRQVHLLFEYQGGEMKHLRQTLFPKEKCNEDVTGQRCSDLLPHLREPSFGDLRCEFISPDGRVMAAAPVPVIAREADLRPATTFVGTCAMPPKFYQLVAQDDYDGPPPQVRLLREGDAGAGAHVFAAVGPGAWQGDNGRSCSRLLATEHGNASPEACRDVCHHAHAQAENNSGGLTDCTIWQWSDNQCRTGGRSKFNNKCKANDQWVGGQLRREAWDAVDTARPNNKRLIAFGCSMPLFGDGTYMNRVPQWIEYNLYNFPDAHFFIFLRGGDGFGKFQHRIRGIPGVTGGTALIYPYFLARVATIVWLPLDLESVLSGSKEAYQRRDENDFLYRTRHLSEWASASVDYDEYFAPTHTVEDGGIRNDGSHFPNLLATDVNMADRDLGGLFFPIHRFLANVSAQVEELVFKKWPALIPDQSDVLYVATTEIATSHTKGKMGKYIIRPLKTSALWTHKPSVPETSHDLQKRAVSTLVVGNMEYNLLHFRDRDWASVQPNHTAKYELTARVARVVEKQLWDRYNVVPHTVDQCSRR